MGSLLFFSFCFFVFVLSLHIHVKWDTAKYLILFSILFFIVYRNVIPDNVTELSQSFIHAISCVCATNRNHSISHLFFMRSFRKHSTHDSVVYIIKRLPIYSHCHIYRLHTLSLSLILSRQTRQPTDDGCRKSTLSLFLYNILLGMAAVISASCRGSSVIVHKVI